MTFWLARWACTGRRWLTGRAVALDESNFGYLFLAGIANTRMWAV